MKILNSIAPRGLLVLTLLSAIHTSAQTGKDQPDASEMTTFVSLSDAAPPDLRSLPLSVTPLSSEMALTTFQRLSQEQSRDLAGYTATTVIDAELPDSAQKAQWELLQQYVAPNVLQFTPVGEFTGDRFVKTNIIVRLLQSEVEHVQQGPSGKTAISVDNYKFSYKGTSQLDGASVYVFQLTPRRRDAGLFKGHIYVDVTSGRLVRTAGTTAKSPSIVIKRIDFVQDYETIDGLTFPVRMHSVTSTRLVGRVVVNVLQKRYRADLRARAELIGELRTTFQLPAE